MDQMFCWVNAKCSGLLNATQHTSSLQLHPHTHHIVTPGFVDRPRQSDCTAGQMDGEAGWWTTSGNIGLPPLARVMGVGRQYNRDGDSLEPCVTLVLTFLDNDFTPLKQVWDCLPLR